MPTPKKKATKRAAAKKTEVQTDRQRAASEEPNDTQQGEVAEGTVEQRSYTPEELAELEHAARVSHNERTGGGTVREGELEEQRVVHALRTAGVSADEVEELKSNETERVSRGFKF